MLRINEERFLEELAALAEIGRLSDEAGGGRDRRPFSPAERRARAFFQYRAEKASLVVRTDAAANLSARLPSEEAGAKTLLLGSHLDTVPHGGPYDGALGVMAALEVLRTVREAGLALPVHLEAIAFTDEEGRFGDFFGSHAFTGRHTGKTIEAFLSKADAFPKDLVAMSALVPGDFAPDAILAARRDPLTLAGFIELHIEQGPQLERANIPIGVVDAIFGRRSMQLRFHGRSDHAGTTPLSMRADALVAAAHFVARAPALVEQKFPGTVVTCGGLTVTPGVYNVVPNEVTLLVEFRAADEETLVAIERRLLELSEEVTADNDGLSYATSPNEGENPVTLAPAVQSAVRQACEALGLAHMPISSGALHDAGSLAAVTSSGMIFVPSIGGRSHSPDEDTAAADLVAGADVLLHTALIYAERQRVDDE